MGSYYSFFQAILPPENLGPVLQQWNKLNIKGLQQNIVVQVEQLFLKWRLILRVFSHTNALKPFLIKTIFINFLCKLYITRMATLPWPQDTTVKSRYSNLKSA